MKSNLQSFIRPKVHFAPEFSFKCLFMERKWNNV